MARPLPPVMSAVKDLLNLIEVIKDPKRYEKVIMELSDVHRAIHEDLQGVESKQEADKLLAQVQVKRREVDNLTRERSEDIFRRTEAAKDLYQKAQDKLKAAELLEAQVKQLKAAAVDEAEKLSMERDEFDAYRSKEKLSLKAGWETLKGEQEALRVRKDAMEAKLKKASEVLA